jgi:hypothetical protein
MKKVIEITKSQLDKIVSNVLEEQDMRSVGQKLKDSTINKVGAKFTPWRKGENADNTFKTRMFNVQMYKFLKYIEKIYPKLSGDLKNVINIQELQNKIQEYEQRGLTK